MQRINVYKWLLTASLMLWSSLLTVAFGQQYGSAPSYQFQSTSSMIPIGGTYSSQVSEPFAAEVTHIGSRRNSWGDPDGEGDWEGYGVGELPNPSPVGEPQILLLMALLYAIGRFRKQRSC